MASNKLKEESNGRLQDMVAIVFGGSAGIGFGIAKVLQKDGATVVITGRSTERGNLAEKNLPGSTFIESDISKYCDCEDVAKTTKERFGKINIIVCNAGLLEPTETVDELTEDAISQMIDVNLKGTIFATKACLPYLKESAKQTGKGSRIIFTSSITGPCTGCPGLSTYAATKAGQLGFMRTAAVELALDNITVNAVLPGMVLTEHTAEMFGDSADTIKASIPMKRFGKVEEMGNTVAFLASPGASYITGQGIVVDGGLSLPECTSADPTDQLFK